MNRKAKTTRKSEHRTGLIHDSLASRDMPLPLYQQVKNYILERLRTGEWPPGTRVSSENDLTRDMGVSRMTVNRAVRELAAEGHLMRLQGVGTFVSEQKPEGALLEIRSVAEEIESWGGKHSADVIVLREEEAGSHLAEQLGLQPGATVFRSALVHKDRSMPVLYCDRYVNPAVAPDYLAQDFTSTTPSEYLVSVAPVQKVEHVIEAALPDRESRSRLRIRQGEPCLILYRRTWSFNMVATSSRLVYPGSRYRLGGRFQVDAVRGSTVA
jgi:GntR family transcriptional regulator, histidine utilization repressor